MRSLTAVPRAARRGDRAVHQHADPERQPAERHDVERDTPQVHEKEAGDYRDGDRQPNHHGAAQAAQE